MKADNTEFWSGLAALGLSLFVVYEGYKLKIGTINDPGSGYVMVYAGLLMIVFSLIILFYAIKDGGPTFLSHWRDVLWTKPLIVIALLLAFTLVFEAVGFLASTTLLLLALLRAIDPVRWPRAIPIAIVVPLVVWFVLQKLLLIQLPSSVFDIWYVYVVDKVLLPFRLAFVAVGFIPSTTALLIAVLRATDAASWRQAIPIGILVPLAFWFVLKKMLSIQLPAGVLGIG